MVTDTREQAPRDAAVQQLKKQRDFRGHLLVYVLVDTKLGPRWTRGSEPRPVMSARVWDGVRGAGGGKGRAGGSRVSGRWGQLAPGGQAAPAGVMVMVQPGLSFCSCRIR
jgi:hypothetical protein